MDKMMKAVIEEIGRIGRVPWIAGGDWNRTPSEAGAWWTGVGELCCSGKAT